MRYRCFGINILFRTDALGSQFIEPGEDQGNREPDRQQAESSRANPIRQVGEVFDYLCYLRKTLRRLSSDTSPI